MLWEHGFGRCLVAAMLLAPAAVHAVTFSVNSTLDKPDWKVGDGVCSYAQGTTLCSLRAAVMEGNATPLDQSVTVRLVPGATYVLNTPEPEPQGARAGDLDITRPMTIGIPENSDLRAKIDANHISRVFQLYPAADFTHLFGIEIVNARIESGYGIAIESSAARMILERLDIHSSHFGDGFGFPCAVDGPATIIESRIHHNGSDESGVHGVCSDPDGPLIIVRSTLDHNTIDGVNVQHSQLRLDNSTVAFNKRLGMFVYYSEAKITRSTISGNLTGPSAQPGQILFSSDASDDYSLDISGSIVDGGGKLACHLNEDHEYGPFVSAWNVHSDASCLSDVFWDNSIHNSTINLSELEDWGGPTPTMLPLPGSDAIDRAPGSVCNDTPVDQRGLPRPLPSVEGSPSRCDIGAVELTTMPNDEPPPDEDPPPDGDPLPAPIFADGFEGL